MSRNCVCIVDVWPLPDVSSSWARCSARNGIVQTASLQCSARPLCLREGTWTKKGKVRLSHDKFTAWHIHQFSLFAQHACPTEASKPLHRRADIPPFGLPSCSGVVAALVIMRACATAITGCLWQHKGADKTRAFCTWRTLFSNTRPMKAIMNNTQQRCLQNYNKQIGH